MNTKEVYEKAAEAMKEFDMAYEKLPFPQMPAQSLEETVRIMREGLEKIYRGKYYL